jgi:hypothetical protein
MCCFLNAECMRLRTAIVIMVVTFVLSVLLLRAYLTSGCQLGGRLRGPSGVLD